MGTNSSKAISNVTNKIVFEMEQTDNVNKTTQCPIQNSNINLINPKNCKVIKQNLCGAYTEDAISSISKGVFDAWSGATNAQKIFLLPNIDINETQGNVQNFIKQKINQTCQANSTVTSAISKKDININGCENSKIININTGDIQANCGIISILDSINKTYNPPNTETIGDIYDARFNGLSESGTIGIGKINIYIYAIFYVLLCFFLMLIIIISFQLLKPLQFDFEFFQQ